mmetsp:Transcript_69601/g.181308  ORF Transcript_69601/g.181308 Transcript_69601/m.181308 type:complete len:238 (-) Transcript_69601:1439-2152(-)
MLRSSAPWISSRSAVVTSSRRAAAISSSACGSVLAASGRGRNSQTVCARTSISARSADTSTPMSASVPCPCGVVAARRSHFARASDIEHRTSSYFVSTADTTVLNAARSCRRSPPCRCTASTVSRRSARPSARAPWAVEPFSPPYSDSARCMASASSDRAASRRDAVVPSSSARRRATSACAASWAALRPLASSALTRATSDVRWEPSDSSWAANSWQQVMAPAAVSQASRTDSSAS